MITPSVRIDVASSIIVSKRGQAGEGFLRITNWAPVDTQPGTLTPTWQQTNAGIHLQGFTYKPLHRSTRATALLMVELSP